MLKSVDEVLDDLARSSHVFLRSNSELVRAVNLVAAKDDEKRAAEQAEKEPKNRDSPLRRKPELQAVPRAEQSISLTPWAVLHALGRAIALARQGAARGFAEHWGALKYSQALTSDTSSAMRLSAEGKETAKHYKTLQSGELGTGFALAVAQQVLARRYPDRAVSFVPADTALLAGWSARGTYRPQFFAELWKPGEPSVAIPIACKGNHSNAAYSHTQLASASVHAEAVHIGPWNETPALIFSTELPTDDHVTIHALRADGRGGRLGAPGTGGASLDLGFSEENFFPGIEVPAEGGGSPTRVTGFHVTPDQYEWFGRVLARTGAAGVTAFAGDGEATAQYLTKRQGNQRFTGFAHAAAGSVQDADHTLLGMPFFGTDHVFRLNRTRVEAFSGVEKHLLALLVRGQVEQYRRETYARRTSWPNDSWDHSWGGPVSVRPDGTVLAIRLLPDRRGG
ncbi:hypothetical protein ABT324_02395 [Saccharopolyspora sp. NPDC000359]|uniref:hypothetical protein n=1 Tax=Saccharopolyspora sp. NPDC000359 TaxID=3154251 RepID=UPI003319BC3B